MTKLKDVTSDSRLKKYPRLDARGREVLDPTPVVAYLKVDQQTGEVLQDGRIRRETIPSRIQRIVDASYRAAGYDYGDYDDDDFEVEENDGSLPVHTPHTVGFTEAMAPPEPVIRKMAKKRGYRIREDEAPPASPPVPPSPPVAGAEPDAPKK